MRDISYRHISGSVERFCDKALTLNATARSTSLPNSPPLSSTSCHGLLTTPSSGERGGGGICGKLGWQKVNRRHRLSRPASGTKTGKGAASALCPVPSACVAACKSFLGSDKACKCAASRLTGLMWTVSDFSERFPIFEISQSVPVALNGSGSATG